jgi:hypothetical protein
LRKRGLNPLNPLRKNAELQIFATRCDGPTKSWAVFVAINIFDFCFSLLYI